MYAMLGDVRFEFLNSFSDFEENHTAAFAKHEVLAGRPRLQAMGNGLTGIRFSLRLHWQLGSVDAAYKGLIAAKEAQQAVSLVFGSGRFMGWFVIESVSARTLIQDGQGRTAARELDVELTEFVGDPNNPLPTPGVAEGGKNPLLAMLPESVQGTVAEVAEAVDTGVRLYRTAETVVGEVRGLVTQARALGNDPGALFGLVGDALALGGGALEGLGALSAVGGRIGDVSGAADALRYGAQAARELGEGMIVLRQGMAGGTAGDWVEAGAAAVDAAAASLRAGNAGVQSLAAWRALRKDAA